MPQLKNTSTDAKLCEASSPETAKQGADDLKEDIVSCDIPEAVSENIPQQVNSEKLEKEQKFGDVDVECVCCGAVLSEEFAIWFRHRYYCCKECLPEETSRGYRLVSLCIFFFFDMVKKFWKQFLEFY